MSKLGDLVIDLKCKYSIMKLQKILVKLEELDHKAFAKSEDNLFYLTKSVKEIPEEKLKNYVYYERLEFAINDLNILLAFAKFTASYQVDITKDKEIEAQKAYDHLYKLTQDVMTNPIGFLYLEELYCLHQALEERIDGNKKIFVNSTLSYLMNMRDNNKDDIKMYNYFNDVLQYFQTRMYLNNPSEEMLEQLKKQYLDDYYERYCYFDGRNYGKTIKTYLESINNIDLDKYYGLLDDKYYNVLKSYL